MGRSGDIWLKIDINSYERQKFSVPTSTPIELLIHGKFGNKQEQYTMFRTTQGGKRGSTA